MNTKKISIGIVSLATVATLVASIAVIPANAQAVSASVSASAKIAQLPKIISRSDTDISARLTTLSNLNTRIQGMKNVSASEKANISNEIQTDTNGLTSLKAKIDADTDVTVAQTDEKSIFGSFRIYVLVVPQGYLEASVDRVQTITSMLSTISAKLQARITTDQNAGKNVTALQASLTDLNAKIADANTQATTAQNAVINLTPDQGNATIAASNKSALVSARANIKTATSDLQAARSDAKTIVQALKNL